MSAPTQKAKAPPPKNAQHDRDACEQGLAVAAQFLNLAAAGIAFVVGLVFSTDPRLNPWLVVVTCGIFGISIFLGLMVRMGVTSNIAQKGDYDVYAGPIRFVAAFQIVFFMLGIVVLGGVTFRQAFAARHAEGELGPEWHSLHPGKTEGISGLALVAHERGSVKLLAVHDNKLPGEKRLSFITREANGRFKQTTVPWPGADLPVDLEAICRVPGESGAFLALTSAGAIHRFAMERGGGMKLETSSQVPNAKGDREFEGLDLWNSGGAIIACWAERGGDTEPEGTLFCATIDPATLKFGAPVSAKMAAPWPLENVRAISDLRILGDGTVLATSASDPGDAGPFASALYVAASIRVEGTTITLRPTPSSPRLLQISRHKIEALELAGGATGGLILGADDENRGGAITFSWTDEE